MLESILLGIVAFFFFAGLAILAKHNENNNDFFREDNPGKCSMEDYRLASRKLAK